MDSPQVKNDCPTCQKQTSLCVCDLVKTHPSRCRFLVLQHPQEPDKDLGSAWLVVQNLQGAQLKVGLSWPNFQKASASASAQPAQNDPTRWGVLYLGSGPKGPAPHGAPLFWTDKKGVPKPAEENRKLLQSLQGIVILDGTWSQAKALWWRNPWLLKLKRLMLAPPQPSLYRELRKEPRRECLSTIESMALALDALGEPAATSGQLRSAFQTLLKRYRAL